MYNDRTIKLVLHCWLETAPSSPTRTTPAMLVSELLSTDNNNNEAPENARQLVFGVVKVSHLTSRLNFLLKQKDLLGRRLGTDLSAIRSLLCKPTPFASHFLSANVPKQIALAVRRQIKTGDWEETDGALSEGELFFQ